MIALASVIGMPGVPGMPVDASAEGHRIDDLLFDTNVLVAALLLVVVGWLATIAVRFGKGHQAAYEKGDGPRAWVLPVALGLFVLLVIDGNLFVRSTRDTAVFDDIAAVDADPGVVRIEVSGRQWAWDIRYAGADGRFATPDDVVTLNDMRLPVDRPVSIQLGAVDVIHGFYLPNFRVKRDAVPGMVNRVWFRPVELGTYDLACSQHCGANHYLMAGRVTVLPDDQFEDWIADESRDAKARFDPETTSTWGWTWRPVD